MSADDDMGADLEGLLNDLNSTVAKKAPAKKTAKAAAPKVEAAPEPEPEPVAEEEQTSETSPAPIPRTQPRMSDEDLEVLREQIKMEVLQEFRSTRQKADTVRQSATQEAITAKHKGSGETGAIENPMAIPETDVNELPPIIHFVSDGFTINEKVTYRGQEYVPTKYDAWSKLDQWQQVEAYGEEKFRPGPWKGKSFNLNDPALSAQDKKKLQTLMQDRYAQRIEAPVPTEA